MSAALRRLCTPKPTSGKLEVNQEVYKQWKQGGTQRKSLLDIFIKANGDKDMFYRVWFDTIFIIYIYTYIYIYVCCWYSSFKSLMFSYSLGSLKDNMFQNHVPFP